MSDHPWLPLWVGDFVSDTAHLSDAETGQYLLLLMCMWRNGGTLPDDATKLARVARCSKVSPDVMAFFQRSDGTITQKRLTEEIEKANAFSAKQSANAKARWLKNKEAGDANAYAKPMPSQSQSQSHTESQSKTIDSSHSVDREFREEFWPVYPDKTAKPYALKCFRAARKKASLPTILGGLKLYIETKPPDRQWCHPSTWLNQERWADEPAPIVLKRSRTVEALDAFVEETSDGISRRGLRETIGEHAYPQLSYAAERPDDLCEAIDDVVPWETKGTG